MKCVHHYLVARVREVEWGICKKCGKRRKFVEEPAKHYGRTLKKVEAVGSAKEG